MASTPDLNKPSSFDLFKIITPALTLITVIVGVYQFNQGQKENKQKEVNMMNKEILTKYKDNQSKIYSDVMITLSYLSDTTNNFNSKEYKETLKKLDQLYWVGLFSAFTPEVETAVRNFMTTLDNDYKDIDQKVVDLQFAMQKVAETMKKSARDYSLPGGLSY